MENPGEYIHENNFWILSGVMVFMLNQEQLILTYDDLEKPLIQKVQKTLYVQFAQQDTP